MTGCEKNEISHPGNQDNLIVYGKIYTAKVDESKSKEDATRYVMAEAMVVRDGKFVYVGTKAEVDKFRTDNSRIIDRPLPVPAGNDLQRCMAVAHG